MDLPHGVQLNALKMHRDERGWLTEIYRDDWRLGMRSCQWNATYSQDNVLRGLHVHHKHNDYLILLRGRVSVGLYDARPKSQTHRMSAITDLQCEELSVLQLPVGVMHGFYCHEPSLYIYGVDSYFDPDDELGCYWADPSLKIDWPCRDPLLSERDRQAGTLAEVEAKFRNFNSEFS
jgi:dTDP-4-dehydrorhamnose 3,5-epimerase